MFSAPQYSSPPSSSPSTPNKNQDYGIAEPSTTPAGPPPSEYTAASFTPRGPPPSSVFASSQLRSGQSPANRQIGLSRTDFNSPKIGSSRSNLPNLNTRTKNGTPGRGILKSSAFTMPGSSPFPEPDDSEQDPDGDKDMMDGQLLGGMTYPSAAPRGLKRSNRGEPITGALIPSGDKVMAQEESVMASIAKSMTAQSKATTLREPDDLVLRTENLVGRIYQQAQDSNSDQQKEISKLVKDLTFTWKSFIVTDSVPGGIGPKGKASPLTTANYLSSLLLQLHHPPPLRTQALSIPHLGLEGLQDTIGHGQPGMSRQTPIPKALLDWLNQYHNPFPTELEDVTRSKPSSTAHDGFWDVLFATTLRGQIAQVIRLLNEADFGHASSALDDGYEEPGYYGDQLESVKEVVANTVNLLESCPALSGDWDVKGKDWALFRRQIDQVMTNLELFAERDSRDKDDENGEIGTSSRSTKSLSLSTASRRAESRVPWTIYENLKTLYGQLRGSFPEITLAAQDWVEATIYATVWWDGEDREISRDSLAASRRSINRSQPREVDIHPLQAYKDKLFDSYMQITEEPEDAQLTVKTSSPVQVGLACIFEDNLEHVIDLISTWSMTVASALVEIGGQARWLPQAQASSDGMLDGFDNSDLMVLSYAENQQPSQWKAADVVTRYAELLSQKPHLLSSDKKTQREGWELAVQVLSRLSDRQTVDTKISDLLNSLSLDSHDRVDKVLNLCSRLGLEEPARNVAQKYADHLHDTSSNYGSALLYYARAHNNAKIKEILNLLIAYSLVLSSAYPPQSDLDTRLQHFLASPQDSLATLANIDNEAAHLLSIYLSGYATLRKFYDLRDEEVNLKAGQKPDHRPLARKREAAAALMALIDSASDSVRGGLYDPDADAVVQVDALLALLGEALPFINQSLRILTQAHITTLLRAVEDLQAAPSRLYADASECLHAALTHASSGADAPSPRAILRKSTASQFSLVGGSQMWGSGEQSRRGGHGEGSSEGSGVLVDSTDLGQVKRGWDWRREIGERLPEGREAEALVRMVRVRVTEKVARAWMEGEG